MKLPLAKRHKNKATGPAPDDSARKQASIAGLRTQLLLAGIVILCALSGYIYQYMGGHVSRVIRQETATTGGQIAAHVADLVEYYSGTAEALVQDSRLFALFSNRDTHGLQAYQVRLRQLFPHVLNVQLLPAGLDSVDEGSSPPLGYAALAQMRAVEEGTGPAVAEVHRFNTPQQYISIVRGVRGETGRVIGHVRVTLGMDALENVLGGLEGMTGYVELRQAGAKGRPVIIAMQGDGHLKAGEPGGLYPVAGTRWQLAYWPAVPAAVYLARAMLWVLVAVAVAAALYALLVSRLTGRLRRGLQQGLDSSVSLLEDFRDGHVKRDYPGGLKEADESLNTMIRIASAGMKGGSIGFVPAPRERDADYLQASAPSAQAGDTDTGPGRPASFDSAISTEALVVEEEPVVLQEETVSIDPSIFRAYDIRGVVDQTLTTGAVRLIGRAIGSEALQRGRDTVVVGRDGRLSGPALSRALIEGIVQSGCNVRDIGCVPTPVLYFATFYLDTQTGVEVTGSHNPPDYNGLKIVIDGETLSGESIQALRERIEMQNFISGQGTVQSVDIIPDYMERIRGDVSLARSLRVAVDCGNGVAGAVAPELLRSLGCEVVELFCEVDGNFPNHHPDPSKEANLSDLIETVRSGRADIGLAFDGDGDRLGVVDSNGSIVWPDRTLMLFAMDILERNPGGQIIYDVKCTRHLDSLIRENGGQPLMWKTGHSFIKAKLKESGALLAGEMSGHIFIKERWYGFDDGIYSAARLLEILAKDPRMSAHVFADLPDSVNTPELNVAMQEGEPPVFIDKLLESSPFGDARVSTIDGLRADFADGWGLVRASNTTPVLVLRFEADNQEALARIMDEFRQAMLQVDPGLSLPF